MDRFRRNLKLRAVSYLGGACIDCGYDRCVAALCFHHVEPNLKHFSISKDGNTAPWSEVQKELVAPHVNACRTWNGPRFEIILLVLKQQRLEFFPSSFGSHSNLFWQRNHPDVDVRLGNTGDFYAQRPAAA